MDESTPAVAEASLFAFEPAEVLRALRTRAWLVALCAVATAAIFWFHSSRQQKVYIASATVVLEPALPKVLGDGFDVDENRATAQHTFFNTQYGIMRSRAVLREAIARLKLHEDKVFLADYGIQTDDYETRFKAVETTLRNGLEVQPERESNIVHLNFEDFNPDRAARIVNEITQTYLDQSLERRLDATKSASKWLDGRVDDFASKLDTAQSELFEFKRRNMLVSVSLEDRKNMTTEALTALNTKLIETRARIIELEAERRVVQTAVEAHNSNLDDLTSVPRVAKNEVINQLRTSRLSLESRRAELASRYGARHPTMISTQGQIDEINTQLTHEFQLVIAGLDNEIAALKNTQTSLESEMRRETERAMDLNNLALEYSRLNRDVGTTEKTYESLLKRQTETELSGRLESNFVRWLEKAEPRLAPIRPSVRLDSALGGVVGLFLGFGLVFLGVLLDNTVHSQADVEERLKLMFLGLVPGIEGDEKRAVEGPPDKDKDLYVLANPMSAVAECARSIRTNLLFLGTNRPMRRLLLTSAGPAEGKSMIAVTLGTTMALAGHRVLLIDTDLRRPRLHRTFGVSSETGLTSALLEASGLDAAIKSTDVPGLDLLPCGPLPPNPSELLHSQAFIELLDRVGERYDRILLDSPPVNAVTDPTILAQMADGTILVVRASKTTKEAAQRAARQLRDVKANLLGVVLNQVDLQDRSYYQHYYHYYRRGYGYGTDEKPAEV